LGRSAIAKKKITRINKRLENIKMHGTTVKKKVKITFVLFTNIFKQTGIPCLKN